MILWDQQPFFITSCGPNSTSIGVNFIGSTWDRGCSRADPDGKACMGLLCKQAAWAAGMQRCRTRTDALKWVAWCRSCLGCRSWLSTVVTSLKMQGGIGPSPFLADRMECALFCNLLPHPAPLLGFSWRSCNGSWGVKCLDYCSG